MTSIVPQVLPLIVKVGHALVKAILGNGADRAARNTDIVQNAIVQCVQLPDRDPAVAARPEPFREAAKDMACANLQP